MGGKSTSNGAVLDSRTKPTESAFDLRSWQGLTEVLRLGKESIKDANAYSEFRNLVLEYAQKGGDAEIRKKIEVVMQGFNGGKPIRPTVVSEVSEEAVIKQTPPSAPKLNVQPRRSEPSFVPRAVPEPSQPARQNSVIPHNLPPEEKKPAVTNEHLGRKVDIQVPAQPPVPETGPVVPKEVTKQDDVVVPPPEVKPEPVVQSVPKESVAVHKTMDEYKTRISEIKRLVHERVGNPAMLIDTHNDAGKKYMVALLTALKATGAGSAVGIESAMSSLEDAYTALLNDAPQPTTPKAVVEEKKEVSAPTPVVPKVSTPTVKSAVPHVPEKRVEPPVRMERDKEFSQKRVVPIVSKVPTPKDIAKKAEMESVVPPTPRPPTQERPVPAPTKPIATDTKQHIPVPDTRSVDMIKDIQKTPEESRESRAPIATPVLPSLSRPPVEKTAPVVQQAELVTPEISNALDSLLHEWSLFSGSGLFGTGPGGADHPLYKRISTLSMGEVLAGRFEKADAKVIRVIKEYVDAWRHEQAVAYNINETFEHYLRRVVQRILKRQSQ